jgi:4-amino-4-deoxy-L-arabinose transferase-like glycosyltransferase
MRRSLVFVRHGAGVLLLLAGLSGLALFGWWQKMLTGLSADGVILPHTWQMLRIMIIALLAPGLALLLWHRLHKPIRTVSDKLAALSMSRFLWISLGAAAAARLAWVAAAPLRMYADWATYDELGWRMAQTGALAEATHLTMYRPPAYPFVLSMIYRAFGHAPQVAVLLNVLLGVGIVYLAYRLARRIGGETAGRWAALLLVLFPSQILYINLTSTEPLFTFLLLLGLELFLAGREGSRHAVLLLSASGIALGLATLTRSLTLPLPFLMVPLLFGTKIAKRHAVAGALTLLVASAAVVTPWIVRNYRLNGLLTVSTNGSMVFYIGNNPGASFGFNRPDPKEFAGYSPQEEARIDSLAWARGWEYIRARPVAFVRRGVMKTAFLMSSDTEGWAFNLAREAEAGRFGRDAVFAVFVQAWWYLFMLVSASGLWTVCRSGRCKSPGVLLCVGTIAFWLALHFVFFGEGRYHYPIVPIMAAFAAVALSCASDDAHRSPA